MPPDRAVNVARAKLGVHGGGGGAGENTSWQLPTTVPVFEILWVFAVQVAALAYLMDIRYALCG